MRKVFSNAHLSFNSSILLLLTPVVVCLIGSIVFFSVELGNVYSSSEKLFYDILYSSNSTLISADRDFYQAQMAAMSYHTRDKGIDDATAKEMIADYEENKQQALDNVNAAVDVIKKEEDLYSKMTAEGGDTIESLHGEFTSAFNTWESGYDIQKDSGKWNEYNEAFLTARGYINEMTDIIEAWAEEEDALMAKQIKATIIRLSTIFLVIAVIAVIIAIAAGKAMGSGLKRVAGSIDIMADGDFVTLIDRDSPIKEFEGIAVSADEMRKKLQAALLEVAGYAENVNEGAANTEQSVSDNKERSVDISRAVEDLANGATSMAQDVESTSGLTINIGRSVESVLHSTEGNAENGKVVFTTSEQVKQQLEEIKASGEKTNDMAVQVAESVGETANVVAEISNAAEAIMGIATQTNLLALNASIEAARAGEAGKGFAVVADNIKQLAEESNNTAKEITDMLSRIVELSDKNKTLTGKIEQATKDEAVDLDNMVNSFEQMMELLKETEEGNANILDLVESLNADKNSVIESVDSLSAISQENAASTQETSAVLQEMTNNMEAIVNQANLQKEAAQGLQNSIARFKVR